MDNQRSRPACANNNHGCPDDCPLAPYFPTDRQAKYANAHRLFGRRRLTLMIRNTSPKLREDLISSVIFEANMRALNLRRDCYGLIPNLLDTINDHMPQLEEVNHQLLTIIRNGEDPWVELGMMMHIFQGFD